VYLIESTTVPPDVSVADFSATADINKEERTSFVVAVGQNLVFGTKAIETVASTNRMTTDKRVMLVVFLLIPCMLRTDRNQRQKNEL
jgi:hypothetical protein